MTSQPSHRLARPTECVRAAGKCLQSAAHKPALLFAGLAILAAPVAYAVNQPKPTTPALHAERDFGSVPLSFEPNQGQTAPQGAISLPRPGLRALPHSWRSRAQTTEARRKKG